MRFFVHCETLAHVLRTQFAFLRCRVFFLKGVTVVFSQKKCFVFFFNYAFFPLFFPQKKSFFIFFVELRFCFATEFSHVLGKKKFVFFLAIFRAIKNSPHKILLKTKNCFFYQNVFLSPKCDKILQ
jgi:hypothetical protein